MPTALIVGASRGIGRALAEELARRGDHVIATVRDPATLASVNGLEVETLDVTDHAGIDALRGRLEGRTLDLLFASAGIMGPDGAIGDVEPDAFAQLLLTNTLAPLRLIERLVDLVPAGGTVAAMSSTLGSIALNDSAGMEAYRISKAALDMGLRSIATRRRGEGRTWLAVHPGWVRTDMGGPSAEIDVGESVTGIADMLEARRGAGGLAFVDWKNRELPW
jgi:NAD(P)-dependent dehydrogenase (short-subunit alcohol dehydrogenase family)